jgi:NAD(P)-dependent dehydrogenase (short-subunit alcohol dehydrogenase family)
LDRFSLEGKTAIVTGGGTGLGKVICLTFARAGADVVIAARRSGPINETAAEVRKLGQRAMAVPIDVTDSGQVNNLIEKSLAEFGKIDILVNNAGIAKGVDPSSPSEALAVEPRPIWELSDDEWHYSIDTNLTGAFYCCRAVAKYMVKRNSGKVINVASIGGLRGVKGVFAYSSAKAGVIMLTKTLAVTWSRYNIQVNCIAPGFIPVADVTPDIEEHSKRFLPMGRQGEPREIGPLAVYLASGASDYVTGGCFVIDGAASAGYAPTGYTPTI